MDEVVLRRVKGSGQVVALSVRVGPEAWEVTADVLPDGYGYFLDNELEPVETASSSAAPAASHRG